MNFLCKQLAFEKQIVSFFNILIYFFFIIYFIVLEIY